MHSLTPLIFTTIALALFFDFLNGFHDAANSIATVVSTRVLKPHWAVLWAAFFNFLAFLVFGVTVAKTIGSGLIDPSIVSTHLILSSLIGAIFWNILTWYLGLPSSSSHALIGGLIGSAIAQSGFHHLKWLGIGKVLAAIVLSPLLGFVIGMLIMFLVVRIFYNFTPARVDRWFRHLQIASSAFISLSHGGNDAQKTMGVIAVLLFSNHLIGETFHIPFWVVISCYLVISLGTLMGGWRIVKTMGMRITKLKPVGGFCAEMSSAITLSLATFLGIPVSTTHTITGSITGVGSIHSIAAVRWGVAKNIVWAWILTIPAAGLVAGIIYWILHFFLL